MVGILVVRVYAYGICVMAICIHNCPHAANKATIEITQFPVSPMSAISGRSATLKCNATAGSSIGYIQWAKGSTAYYPIHEDPYCSSNYGVSHSVEQINISFFLASMHKRKCFHCV